jgi:hypothetical protein
LEENPFPEFEDYQYLRFTNTGNNEPSGFKGMVIYYLGRAISKIGETLSSLGFPDKVMRGSQHAFQIVKSTGRYFVVYSTPVVIAVGAKTVDVIKDKSVQVYRLMI